MSNAGSSQRTQSKMYMLFFQLFMWIIVDWLVRGLTFLVIALLNGSQQDPSVIYRKFATPGIFGPKLPFLLPVYVPIALVVILAITRRPLTTKLAVILGVSITAAALVSMSFYMVSQHLAPFAWGWQFPPAVLVQSSVGVLIASQIPRFKTFEEEA